MLCLLLPAPLIHYQLSHLAMHTFILQYFTSFIACGTAFNTPTDHQKCVVTEPYIQYYYLKCIALWGEPSVLIGQYVIRIININTIQ